MSALFRWPGRYVNALPTLEAFTRGRELANLLGRKRSRHLLTRAPGILILSAAAMCLTCATYRPNPDFKSAVAVEYYDCDPGYPPCPGSDTEHVAIDSGRFRRSVESAVYVKFKTWRKGSSLLRVTLPDGTVKDLLLPFGQTAIDPGADGGSWIFEPDGGQEFDELMGSAWNVVFPARVRRYEDRYRRTAVDAAPSGPR